MLVAVGLLQCATSFVQIWDVGRVNRCGSELSFGEMCTCGRNNGRRGHKVNVGGWRARRSEGRVLPARVLFLACFPVDATRYMKQWHPHCILQTHVRMLHLVSPALAGGACGGVAKPGANV